jgi:hypothetical protein
MKSTGIIEVEVEMKGVVEVVYPVQHVPVPPPFSLELASPDRQVPNIFAFIHFAFVAPLNP